MFMLSVMISFATTMYVVLVWLKPEEYAITIDITDQRNNKDTNLMNPWKEGYK